MWSLVQLLLLGTTTVTSSEKETGYLPSIFLVGTQKGGSSSLFELLIQHPLLLKGSHKESHFWNNEMAYAKGLQYYKTQYFPSRKASLDEPLSMFIDGTPMMDCTVCWKVRKALTIQYMLSYFLTPCQHTSSNLPSPPIIVHCTLKAHCQWVW